MTAASYPEIALEVRGLTISFVESDGSLDVLDDLSFQVEKNSFVCLIGPSGGGKSTLLRAIGGLLAPTSGQIIFPQQSHSQSLTGMVFQKPNLMPWRTLFDNISLPLQLAGKNQAEIQQSTREMIDLVGLRGFENHYPHELSGGMAQRVAIARSLVHDPEILLLDEPFGQLDALTRERMGEELLRIWGSKRKTILMVTHSISEAIYLADRVIVLTSRPAKISLDLPVPLERPRRQEMRYSPEFSELSRILHQQLSHNEENA
ncbi:MAG: ABC transporter ATP-binding protein [Chloroflexi bacterium]|jgi:NitT/TauT family transport system ATP-binding protein|nr:ABC transporter ATP-binding protein [Anaerolineaceae bacterium]NLI45106.1 ABC transporter ATP-binding protein [Chloroflexota bacterium]HOE34362.1 ABC transporter ATP-binding protein [Anaerolineaceae bacterium]HOT25643.1 ABC transporter ATP-binding protein [Anaerolineaceae bacterium]HQH57277.1 ABC transporter ATP-binding protein [Anaerolineaceae bacterium]